MSLFVDLFTTLDSTLNAFQNTAVTNLAGYVTNFVRVAGIVALILAAIELKWAAAGGFRKIIGTFVLIAIVSQLATVPALYNQYIGGYLMDLPDDLLSVMSPAAFGDTGGIGDYLDKTISAMMDSISLIWAESGIGNLFAPIVLGAILFVLLIALAASAMIAIVIGKVGIALVVALGPLFVMTLLIPGMKDWFTKWLSYAFSMAILQLLIGAVMLVARTILNTYATALTDPASQVVNSPGGVMAPAIIMLVLTYIFGQLPNMASSLGGGIGLTAGNAAWNLVKSGANAAGWQIGGKQLAAHNTAAQRLRVEESYKRQAERGNKNGGGTVSRGTDRPRPHTPGSDKK
jgi:type IV secretion system protein VirB6